MKNLLQKDREEVIYLNKNFYSKEAIRECVQTYREFIYFNIEESERYVRVRIESKDRKSFPNKLLANEFKNYLVALEYKILNSRKEKNGS